MTVQATLFHVGVNPLPDKLRFDGSDYDPQRDNKRLGNQLTKIFELMKDGVYRSLNEIAAITGEPEASISAQLRHLRKKRFGSHDVNKRHEGNGFYKYQLIVKWEPTTK